MRAVDASAEEDRSLLYSIIGCLAFLMATNVRRKDLKLFELAVLVKEPLHHGFVEIFFMDGQPAGYFLWGYITNISLMKIFQNSYALHPSEWVETESPAIVEIYIKSSEHRKEFFAFLRSKFLHEKQVRWVHSKSGLKFSTYDIASRKYATVRRL